MPDDTVTRERLAQLEQVAGEVVEVSRIASQPEGVAPASIESLARAAGCEWAAFWVLDTKLRRVRRVVAWSALGLKLQLWHGRTPPRRFLQ